MIQDGVRLNPDVLHPNRISRDKGDDPSHSPIRFSMRGLSTNPD
jgi:hypothetical protein